MIGNFTYNVVCHSVSFYFVNYINLFCCGCIQSAMQDSWFNIGFLGDELKPYREPNEAIDEKRIGNYVDIM